MRIKAPVIVFFALLCLAPKGHATLIPIEYEIIDVYSSVNFFYSGRQGAGSISSDNVGQVNRSGLSASLSFPYDYGIISGTQFGTVAADPAKGLVTVSGGSTLNIADDVVGSIATWSKHFVSGKFVTPGASSGIDEIFLHFEVEESVNASLNFTVGKSLDDILLGLLPDVHYSGSGRGTSFTAVYSKNSLFPNNRYTPGEELYFTLGIQPGIGGSLEAIKEAGRSNDLVSGYYQWYYEGQPTVIPETSTLFLLGTGVLGLIVRRNR